MSKREDPYEGISDAEQKLLQDMYGEIYGPQVIIVFYLGLAVLFGFFIWGIGYYFFHLPSAVFWLGFFTGIVFEVFYWFRILREAYSHPWIDLTYRVIENPDYWWVNELMLVNSKELGRTGSKTPVKGKYGKVVENATEGDYIYELSFNNKAFPIGVLHSHKKLGELCSWKGSWSVIIHRNFFFTITDITALSVVRVDHDSDDLHPFIPIFVPTDYSSIVNEVANLTPIPIKHDEKELAETAEVYDKHYRTLYYKNWQLEMAHRKKLESVQENLDKLIERRAAVQIKRLKRAGQLDTGAGFPKQIFTRRNIIGIAILMVALFIISLVLRGR